MNVFKTTFSDFRIVNCLGSGISAHTMALWNWVFWKRVRRSPPVIPYLWLLGLGLLILVMLRVMLPALLWIFPPSRIRDQNTLEDFVGTLAQVLSGVLGFTISVVAIVVQLSAGRFTPKVTELFLREKVNFFMILFLIVANLVSVWTSLAFSFIEKPIALVIINLILGTLSFVLLIPYFIFVFNFLRPNSIINKIEQQIRQAVIDYCERTQIKNQIIPAHCQCLSALDELKGIANSAIQQRESPIVLEALDSLKTFALFYGDYKCKLSEEWFSLTQPLRRDLDFVSVDDATLREIQTKKLWLEVKIFRQYQSIFTDSLNEFREACFIIGINTREMAEQAFQRNELEMVNLAVKSFNTYLRAVIDTQDIRTGYNIVKQYRLVAEAALQKHHEPVVLDIAEHFRYYSLLAYKAGPLFLPETLSFDLSLLAQQCCEYHSDISAKVLEFFLKIDQDPESENHEHTLRGVRKSQVKLAAYYLKAGYKHLAYEIFKDMKHEPRSRLKIIYDELQSARADFWEFRDRGGNFYYVEPELKPFLAEFFSWFEPPTNNSLDNKL